MEFVAMRGIELGEGNRGTPKLTLNRSPVIMMPIKIHAFLDLGTEACRRTMATSEKHFSKHTFCDDIDAIFDAVVKSKVSATTTLPCMYLVPRVLIARYTWCGYYNMAQNRLPRAYLHRFSCSSFFFRARASRSRFSSSSFRFLTRPAQQSSPNSKPCKKTDSVS